MDFFASKNFQHRSFFFLINVTLQPQTEKSHPFAKSSNFYPPSDIRRGGKSRFFTLKNAPPPCLKFSHLHRFCNFTGKDRKKNETRTFTENGKPIKFCTFSAQHLGIFFSNQSTTIFHSWNTFFDATGRKTET